VLCDPCLRERLKPCESCGSLIFASAYQHLPTGRVVCEPCVLKQGSS
jgi:formylmethanofuran dehydrogenase subunit E